MESYKATVASIFKTALAHELGAKGVNNFEFANPVLVDFTAKKNILRLPLLFQSP
jgi:hypothetical protein